MTYIAKDEEEAREIRAELDQLWAGGKYFEIHNGWLVGRVDGCSCGGPHLGLHEPGCGYEPLVDLVVVDPSIQMIDEKLRQQPKEFWDGI